MNKAQFHLPGLFEFYDFYKEFLPLYQAHREYFYDYIEISSIYGAPKDALWSGGRISIASPDLKDVLQLVNDFQISPRLTFSNSLLQPHHLKDDYCNNICKIFDTSNLQPGIIIYSDLLEDYIKNHYSNFYFVSSTTKVITNFDRLVEELDNPDYKYVVPDFRFNKSFDLLNKLSIDQKAKVEFLLNECCDIDCKTRKACYKNVSRQMLEEDVDVFICSSKKSSEGYKFSSAMSNPSFITNVAIKELYMINGFTQFKIEGRGLGSALLLEFILYYMVKPEYQIHVREALYLDAMLDLF